MTELSTTVSTAFHSEVITLTACMLDWAKLGKALRESADDAHENDTPSLDLSYSFLIDNPECFGYEEWPADMPATAPEAMCIAYGPTFGRAVDSNAPSDASDPVMEYVTDKHGYMVARRVKNGAE